MPTGFCETEDVREALQETDLSGSTNESIVTSAITAVSRWFSRATNGHWYDSTASSSDLVDATHATASDVRLDVPSSPHRQDRQLFQHETGVRYPVTRNGPYAKIQLPHPYVTSVTVLEVRGRGGDVEDWVAASDKQEGRGSTTGGCSRSTTSTGSTGRPRRGMTSSGASRTWRPPKSSTTTPSSRRSPRTPGSPASAPSTRTSSTPPAGSSTPTSPEGTSGEARLGLRRPAP